MIRPHWRNAMFTAFSGAVGLAILAGCATRPNGVSAGDEAARYLQNARGRYVIPGSAGDPWGPYIREASNKFDVPETWIRALMRQESGGNLYRNGRLITSSAGAMGLMQVMPGTYRELRARYNLGTDPFDPHDNIMAGVGYMREMYDMYGAPGFLAAYNAGPNRLDDYLANQRGLPDETRKYVASIGPSLHAATPRVRSPAEQYTMNQVPLHIPAGPRYGYGAVPVPSVQLASLSTSYTAPAPVAYVPPPAAYVPAPQPRAVAWSEPPRPVYTPAPAPVERPRAVAWAAPVVAPRPVIAQAQAQEPRRPVQTTRVAMAVPPSPPAHRGGGGLHLISSAVAAESVTVRNTRRPHVVPVSYHKPDTSRTRTAKAAPARTRATGHAQTVCHKDSRGKTVCGPQRL